MSPELRKALDEAIARYDAMTPGQRSAMWQAQRESWVRAFSTPCEHGELDFEQCGECIANANARILSTPSNEGGDRG